MPLVKNKPMDKRPLISILMPVYNAAPFLEACLDSILEQSSKDWELIAVNDQSTDTSLEILRKYASKDERIRVLDNNGKGIILALRLAYSNAKGQYISRMDADDLMPPNKLDLLSAVLKDSGPGYVSTGKVAYFSDEGMKDGYLRYADWLNSLVDEKSHRKELFRECVIPSPAWMIHREDLEKSNAFNSDIYPEDYDLVFRFFEAGLRVRALDELVHLWRDHSGRTSRNDETYSQNAYFDIKVHYLDRIEDLRERQILLWGAGRKGKRLAKLLSESGHSFEWTCNVERKWGHIIHGVKMSSPEVLSTIDNVLVLVAVSGPDDQKDLENYLQSQSLEKGISYLMFC